MQSKKHLFRHTVFSHKKIKGRDTEITKLFFGTTLVNFMTESPQKLWNFLFETSMSIGNVSIERDIVTEKQAIANKFSIAFQKCSARNV